MSRCFVSWQKLAALTLLGLVSSTSAVHLLAQDFRVDTDVYLEDNEETFSEHLTLFRGAIVYDFAVKGHEEITILDLQKGKITLLDVKRRKRTDLRTADLLDFSANIKAIGKEKKGEDLVAPKFEVSFEDGQNSLSLVSHKITYHATGIVPENPTVAPRYREFTDWYARLNSMRPPNPPHFGRLELNRELADRGLVPQDIERTVALGRLFGKPQKARSHHVINMAISGTDRSRIDKAGGYLVGFTKVSPFDYMKVEAVATR